MAFDIKQIRDQFPSLSICDNDKPRVYMDNPAGTQVPKQVLEQTRDYLIEANANLGGHFRTSLLTEQIVSDAHEIAADFVNAYSPNEISFGQNMTTLTFHISRSIGRLLKPGDEIILTRMEHDANIAPWLMLAEDLDLTIKWLDFSTDDFMLEIHKLDELLSKRTKLVAVNYASNLLGTINDVKTITSKAKSVGALVYVDAVQLAPHQLIDVQDLGCDFLVCSPYKFYGPHIGLLWTHSDVHEKLTAYKVRAVSDQAADKFETGTLNHECIAGFTGAMDYLIWIGKTMVDTTVDNTQYNSDKRHYLKTSFDLCQAYENQLTCQLIDGLLAIPTVKIQGISNYEDLDKRVPTVSFTTKRQTPSYFSEKLATENIFVWDGHNYALEPTRRLGLIDDGGVVRIGIAHYNSKDEIDFLLEHLQKLVA